MSVEALLRLYKVDSFMALYEEKQMKKNKYGNNLSTSRYHHRCKYYAPLDEEQINTGTEEC